MTIAYQDGRVTEAFLLSRDGDTMRVAPHGAEDVLELKQVNGTWVTEECEPVQILFAWQSIPAKTVPTEADCICSHELAGRLIGMLLAGDDSEIGVDYIKVPFAESIFSLADSCGS